jgi:hypothetical protein
MSAQDDINKVLKQIEALRDKAEKEFTKTGNEAVELIKKRTRLGYGVDKPRGTKTKLKKLNSDYVASRKRNRPTGPTTPAKSNLTQSGDMLDDLEAKKQTSTRYEITFKRKESRDKAEWVSKDRAFNNLSKSEIKQLAKKLQDRINKNK